MSEEPAMVEVTVGPYRGQRLTMSKAEAQQAVADKWAIDPHAPPEPPPKEGEAPKEAKPMTDEERAEILAKAHAAIAKLRGEEPEKETPPKADPAAHKPPPKAEPTHTRDMAPEKPTSYRTK
jgi:hypothetical protein